MHGRLFGFAIAMALALVAPGKASAASNSRHAPTSTVERLVCGSPDLRRLDAELGRLYDAVEGETRGIDGETGEVIDHFGDEHQRWMSAVRNHCTNEACLSKAYRTRIAYVKRHWADAL